MQVTWISMTKASDEQSRLVGCQPLSGLPCLYLS